MSVSINHAALCLSVVLLFSVFEWPPSIFQYSLSVWWERFYAMIASEKVGGHTPLARVGWIPEVGLHQRQGVSLKSLDLSSPSPSDLWIPSTLIFQWKNKWALIWGAGSGWCIHVLSCCKTVIHMGTAMYTCRRVWLLENYSPGILLMQISFDILCRVNQATHNKMSW